MRKVLFILATVLLSADSLNKNLPTYLLVIADVPSEIEGREDLMGRSEYLQMLTADPSTGQIPAGIRRAELIFSNKLLQNVSGARSQNLEIESIGPRNVGGRTRAVAFDIRDENIILAGGVSGGVWKSTDGGSTWERKSNPLNRNSVTCIVQDIRPGRENTWYHGTGEIVGNSARGGAAPFRGDGVFKSTDNGETWEQLASTQSNPQTFNSQFQYIWDIETNPSNLTEEEVLIAAYGGILRSLDGGESWQLEIGQELFNLDETVDLNDSNASFYTSLERSSNNIFYATLSSLTGTDEISPEAGFYYSTNGASWTEITPLTDDSQYRRTVVGISPSNPDVAYFMVDSSPIFILEHRLSQLTSPDRINGFDPDPRVVPDFGGTLGDLDTQGSFNMMLRVHPNDENTVFVGGTNLYRSTDAFRTFDNIDWIGGYNPEGGSSVYLGHHPDQHDLLFLPSNPQIAYSASDGGLIRSDNIIADSVFWETSNNGFVTSQFYTVAQSKDPDQQILIGGMQDNGTDFSVNGNSLWSGIIGGDGGYPALTKDNTLWFASFQRGQTLRLTLDEDFDLTSFARVDPAGLVASSSSIYLFINPFVIDPTNENRMFCAGGNHLYFHPNISQIPGGSQTPTDIGWERVNVNPIENGLVSAVEAAYQGNKVYYGTSLGQVFRLNNADDQAMFEVDEITSNMFPENAFVSSIATNPEDSDHLVVVFSNYNVQSIFESTDAGITFKNISGSLEENEDGTGDGPSIRWAEIVPLNSGNLILVGTSIGLFSTESTDGDIFWMQESTSNIGSAIITMMDYRPSDGNLAIATHGNGIFTTSIDDFKEISLLEENDPFQVLDAFPNPFLESTQIRYSIPEDGEVRVDILATNGGLINTILWGPQFQGINSVTWNGENASGTELANGIYLYRINYNGESKSGRLILRR
ncbi:FlgD immunoglobulin-like domain containing protein [Ekhidna sp.]